MLRQIYRRIYKFTIRDQKHQINYIVLCKIMIKKSYMNPLALSLPRSGYIRQFIFFYPAATGAYSDICPGGAYIFFFPGDGGSAPMGPENTLKSIDFTGQMGLSPHSPPLNMPLPAGLTDGPIQFIFLIRIIQWAHQVNFLKPD